MMIISKDQLMYYSGKLLNGMDFLMLVVNTIIRLFVVIVIFIVFYENGLWTPWYIDLMLNAFILYPLARYVFIQVRNMGYDYK